MARICYRYPTDTAVAISSEANDVTKAAGTEVITLAFCPLSLAEEPLNSPRAVEGAEEERQDLAQWLMSGLLLKFLPRPQPSPGVGRLRGIAPWSTQTPASIAVRRVHWLAHVELSQREGRVLSAADKGLAHACLIKPPSTANALKQDEPVIHHHIRGKVEGGKPV